MIDAKPAYLNLAPNFKSTFDRLKKHNPDYIAHEYLNLDWDLMYFSDVAELSQEAKLDFATVAVPIEGANFYRSQKAQAFINKIANPIVREQVQDYFMNRQFRKDLYVRGLRKLPTAESQEKILATRYVLLMPSAEVPMNIDTEVGVLKLSEKAYRPLIAYLEEDNFRPKDFVEYSARNKVSPVNIVEMVRVLTLANRIMPCQNEAAVKLVKKSCDKLNAYICERAKFDESINFLASPLTGCGVNVNRFQQMFLVQHKSGVKTSDKLADAVWKILSRQGQKILFNGKALENPEDNIEHLKTLAERFLTHDLPIFKALLIA